MFSPARPAYAAIIAAALTFPVAVPALADPVVPVYQQFGIYRDVNGDGQFTAADHGGYIGCIGSMNQWLSAGTSYGYKQYNTPAGQDFSAAPSNTAGYYYDPSGNTTHNNWLQPQLDTLQFYMGYSRLDHDPSSPDYAKSAKGFNLGVYMNAPEIVYDANFGYHIFKPTDGEYRNTVALDIAVLNSTLDPWVVLSDDAAFTTSPPRANELPRPYPGAPLPGMELKDDLPWAAAGYDAAFEGVWSYNNDTTDGGVIGNLLPDVGDLKGFVIRISLKELGNNGNGIKQILFNTFSAPGADPYDQVAGVLILPLVEGESFFIVGCCDQAPEPATLALLGFGGLAAVVWPIVRRRVTASSRRTA